MEEKHKKIREFRRRYSEFSEEIINEDIGS